MIVQYVEGHPIDGKEADMAIQRILRVVYGYTLNPKGYRLLKDWQKTPLVQPGANAFQPRWKGIGERHAVLRNRWHGLMRCRER